MTEQHPRDDCYFCGDDERLESHHIFPRRFGGLDTHENLVDVCHDCHMKLERLYDERFYQRVGVPRSDYPPVWSDEALWQISVNPHAYERHLFCAGCRRLGPQKRRVYGPTGDPALECVRCGALMVGPVDEQAADIDADEILNHKSLAREEGRA